MMRKWAYVLLMTLLLVSCSKVNEEWAGPFLEFTLVTDEELLTKADSYDAEGEDRYFENLMNTVDFFFYPDGKTDENATYHRRVSSNKRGSDVLRLEMTTSKVNKYIFPSVGTQDVRSCTVYAIVNYKGQAALWNEEDIEPEESSLSDLEQLVVTSDFVTDQDHRQSNFMMVGHTDLALRGRSQVVSAAGTIRLERYACKITVGLNVSEQVVNAGEIWEPMLSGIEVYLVNGVSNVTLGGEAPEPIYFNYGTNRIKYFEEDSQHNVHPRSGVTKVGDYYVGEPMYTYPQHWTYGSTTGTDKEPYLKLVIPWQRKGGGQKQFYYKVVFPDDMREGYRCKFVSNNWYHINIDVGMLGAETDEATITIGETDGNVSCYIVYWQDKNMVIKNAKIGNARYLSVDHLADTLYNISTKVSYSYVSSHPVFIKNLTAGRLYYGTAAEHTPTLGGVVTVAGPEDVLYPEGTRYLKYEMEYDEETGEGRYVYYENEVKKTKVWFKNTGTAVEFTHVLNNNYKDKSFDYSPYLFHYTLVHADMKDDVVYAKDQTILQYPAIYLEQTINPDTMKNGKPVHWGYVYIGAENSDGDYQFTEADMKKDSNWGSEEWKKANYWRVVTYNGGGRDMYKINATVLPQDSELIIGDPRVLDNRVPDPNINGNSVDYAEDPEGRKLTWYYPTDDGERTVNMIAPSYRISTKLSGSFKDMYISKEQALFRCAALQENGFPAGRWRLPTLGEIIFAAQLSANGVFEQQFGAKYWSANGLINVQGSSVTIISGDEGYVRCVYDSWYWGDERVLDDDGLPTIFKWGDAKRQ